VDIGSSNVIPVGNQSGTQIVDWGNNDTVTVGTGATVTTNNNGTVNGGSGTGLTVNVYSNGQTSNTALYDTANVSNSSVTVGINASAIVSGQPS